jgi:hypothetical protein
MKQLTFSDSAALCFLALHVSRRSWTVSTQSPNPWPARTFTFLTERTE